MVIKDLADGCDTQVHVKPANVTKGIFNFHHGKHKMFSCCVQMTLNDSLHHIMLALIDR